MKKQNVFLTLLAAVSLIMFPFLTEAQNEKQETFRKMRSNDFTKLIGGIQEGARLNYNSEKTNLEGSGGKEIKKAHMFLQGIGSVGTTTNLTALFNQKTLPTFSGSLTAHFLLPNWSTWFYDGTFTRNYPQLQNLAVDEKSISTKINPADANESTVFEYKDNLKEKVANGSFKATDRLYTFKRFFWASVTAKYDNSKYSFFDATRPFSDQLYEPTYNSWTGKGSFNMYLFWNKTDVNWKSGIRWRPNFIYLTVCAQYGLGNNVQQLKKTTINDISSSTVNGTITRQTVKHQNVYNGVFKEFKTFTPSFDLILSPIKSFAINAFGDYNFINGSDKTKSNIDNFGSIATGIYFYGDGNSSKINIGAFYKWTKDNATNSWTEQVGLRTSIPITPLN
jgi:hypothetical protein